jgi:hypothetical protein
VTRMLFVTATTVLVLHAPHAIYAGQETKHRPVTGETMVAVQAWVDAVKAHTPGRADDQVVKTAALSYDAREELNTGLDLFFRGLLDKKVDTQGNTAAKKIVEIGHRSGNPIANAFLKQAAVLHSDVAAYADRFPVRPAAIRRRQRQRWKGCTSAAG